MSIIFTTGREINNIIRKVILEDLNLYQFLIVNLNYHLLDNEDVSNNWSGNFDVVGLIEVANLVANKYLSIKEEDIRKQKIEEANTKLTGLSNHFNNLIQENTTIKKLGLTRYNLSMYLFSLNDMERFTIVVNDSYIALGLMDPNTDLLRISIEYNDNKEEKE